MVCRFESVLIFWFWPLGNPFVLDSRKFFFFGFGSYPLGFFLVLDSEGSYFLENSFVLDSEGTAPHENRPALIRPRVPKVFVKKKNCQEENFSTRCCTMVTLNPPMETGLTVKLSPQEMV